MTILSKKYRKLNLNQCVINDLSFNFSTNDIEIFDWKTLFILEISLILSACIFYQILF